MRSIYLTMAAIYFMSLPASAAPQCLEKNSDEQTLGQGQVYENGQLTIRLDGWSIFNGYIDIRSNAPTFNGRIYLSRMITTQGQVEDKDTDYYFMLVDRRFCPGEEISLRCQRTSSGNNSAWDCRIGGM
jgi:hypothetical protein